MIYSVDLAQQKKRQHLAQGWEMRNCKSSGTVNMNAKGVIIATTTHQQQHPGQVVSFAEQKEAAWKEEEDKKKRISTTL